MNQLIKTLWYLYYERWPATKGTIIASSRKVACWTSEHWVAGSNPLIGVFNHCPLNVLGPV